MKDNKIILSLVFLLVITSGIGLVYFQNVNADTQAIPDWIKNTAKFWIDGKVSDGEFISALQFLVNEGILDVPVPVVVPNPDQPSSSTSTTPKAPVTQLENTVYGPIAYVSFNDSPFFDVSKSSKYFHLEDFEDGALNTPGVSSKNSVILNPGKGTDSVDIDDGLADGFGKEGSSLNSGKINAIVFTFDEKRLGELPNYAGVVFTDGDFGSHDIIFEAYGEDGLKIDSMGPTNLNGNHNSRTENDRFFGISSNVGIKGLKIAVDSDGNWYDIEVDHLQYGRTK